MVNTNMVMDEGRTNCTYKGCPEETQTGDVLFCIVHRVMWVNLCKEVGIHERMVEEEGLNELLRRFQNKLPIN